MKPDRSYSRREVVLFGLTVGSLGFLTANLIGCDPESDRMLVLIESYRGQTLQRVGPYDDYAHRHATRMLVEGRLFHTDLNDLPGDWGSAGEIVGRGVSPDVVFAAFLASPLHKQLLDDPVYTKIGLGSDHTYYAVVFTN